MKRTIYQKPTTEVVNLQQHHQILAGSDQGQAGLYDYNWNTDVVEE